MGFIPIFLQIEGKPCLVVGGGEVALRKVKPLLDAGAPVTVISPQVIGEMELLVASGRISLLRRGYQAGDMEGYHLVYAATDDPELQHRLFLEARALRIPINIADAPEFCSFIVPSVVRRGRLQVAISTAGASPAVASVLRHRIEQWLGDELEPMLELMAAARSWLKIHEADSGARARKLGALAASGVEDAIKHGDAAAVDLLLRRCLGESVGLADLGVALTGPDQSAEPNV